jgi:hypothetical protein
LLNVIINPLGTQQVSPGFDSELRVVVNNQSPYGMVIEVSLDLSSTLHQWCPISRESFNLEPQKSQVVVFKWQVPPQALTGTYNYDLVVDSPASLPAPLRYSLQLEVLPSKQTPPLSLEPTFTIKPTTSSTEPMVLEFGQPLNIEVRVHNRSHRVDEFRLSCDLNDEWFTVRYPEGIETQGLVIGGNKLRLNPNAKGQIKLTLHPPADTLAGSYRPTIYLHSSVNPKLFLQDIIYLYIPPIYNLQVELLPILTKVKQQPGKYEVKLSNKGNTIRAISLQVRTADEEELCQYQLERSPIRIPPEKTVKIGLQVNPVPKWRQSFFGAAKQLNFWVELEDSNDYPLPNNLPLKGILFWESRPWWQLFLLLASLLAIVGLLAFLVRGLFRPPDSLKIISVYTEQNFYQYGQKITLNWKIDRVSQLQKLRFYTDQNSPGEKIEKNYTVEELEINKEKCRVVDDQLECWNIPTGAATAGQYNFILELYSRQNIEQPLETQTIQVKIEEPPQPTVTDLRIPNFNYQTGETIDLKFQVSETERIERIQIVSEGKFRILSTEDLTEQDEQNIPISTLKNQFCERNSMGNNWLQCLIPVSFAQEGNYTLTVKVFSRYPPHNQPEPLAVKTEQSILVEEPQIPLEIVNFTINGRDSSPIKIKPEQKLYIYWEVKGKDVRVTITGSSRTFNNRGNTQLGPYSEGIVKTITLTATDAYNNKQARELDIEVESLPPNPREDERTSLQ